MCVRPLSVGAAWRRKSSRQPSPRDVIRGAATCGIGARTHTSTQTHERWRWQRSSQQTIAAERHSNTRVLVPPLHPYFRMVSTPLFYSVFFWMGGVRVLERYSTFFLFFLKCWGVHFGVDPFNPWVRSSVPSCQ